MITISQSFQHKQETPEQIWNINHNLNCTPVVSVAIWEDDILQVILPSEVIIVDNNNVRIEFTAPRTGIARLT